jgi:hypothetical protein
MAARAQEISMEAGSKVAAAMKDVISAAAGLTGFAVESARDLVQYMIRRGQMTPEEGDKLLREAEEAYIQRKPMSVPVAPAAPRAAPAAPTITTPAEARAALERTVSAKPATGANAKAPAKKAPAAKAVSAKRAAPSRASKSSARPTTRARAKPAPGRAKAAAKSGPASKRKR